MNKLVEAARKFVGTPYQHQGRNPKIALDCIGLVIVSAKEAGLIFPEFDYKNYSRYASGALDRELAKHCELIETIEEGCICTFALSGLPHHCGIITSHDEGWGIIHAYENVGKVTEHRLIPWWSKKIANIYRVNSV